MPEKVTVRMPNSEDLNKAKIMFFGHEIPANAAHFFHTLAAYVVVAILFNIFGFIYSLTSIGGPCQAFAKFWGILGFLTHAASCVAAVMFHNTVLRRDWSFTPGSSHASVANQMKTTLMADRKIKFGWLGLLLWMLIQGIVGIGVRFAVRDQCATLCIVNGFLFLIIVMVAGYAILNIHRLAQTEVDAAKAKAEIQSAGVAKPVKM